MAVQFEWCGDRFLHRVTLIRGAEEDDACDEVGVPLLEAVDGPADSNWPQSPPIQQLDACELAGRRRGLVGVGMAGTSHWSLACETGEAAVWFDVACRVQQRPGSLQSTYRMSESCQISVLGEESGRVLRMDPPQLGFPLLLRTDSRCATCRCVPGGEAIVGPARLPTAWPATARWRFAISR